MSAHRSVIGLLVVSLCVVVMFLSLVWDASAQMPDGHDQPPSPPIVEPVRGPGLSRQAMPVELDASTGDSSVPVGEPGLSFSYVRTFGESEVAYIADAQYLNFPYGIGTVGNSVWIGEQWGNRLLSYDSAGALQKEFGRARFPNSYEDTSFWEIVDVTQDSAGNIWVVDMSSNRVVKLSSSGKKLIELGEWWTEGSSNSQFIDPIGVAFDANGNVYVSDGAPFWSRDRGNHRIQVFRSDGSYLTTIGQTGVCGSSNDQLCGPRHIAIFGAQLYVPDANNNRVQVFDISNPLSPSFAATIGGLNNPSGVAVDATYIFVADTDNNQVQVFDRNTRNHVTTIGTGWGIDNDQFKRPTDVAVDDAGYLYVADWVNNRVQRFVNSGNSWNYARTYGTTGIPYVTDGNHFNNPSGVAVGYDGSIYLTEDSGHRLVKLDANGTLQWTVGAAGVKGDWDDSNDRFNNPDDVAVDNNGRVYVASRWHGRVQIYNPDGSFHASVENLNCPGGVTIGPNGYLYIANTCNHIVNIFDTALSPLGTLGEIGVSGVDNAHFNMPEDVAIDSSGNIYVSDQQNHRVQVYSPLRAYIRTLGMTGVQGDDFGYLAGPDELFIDAADRLYVADAWNNRVQVFDKGGKYLTTIGGSWGSRTGQFRGPSGVAVDRAGNVYVADLSNHRIQKFASGVSGWVQVNINGFGERQNSDIEALIGWNGHLYAGTANWGGNGAQLWRTNDNITWTPVITNGFGFTRTEGISHMAEFGGQLYASTWADQIVGGQVWRSADGTNWVQVVSQGFGDPTNGEVTHMAVFSDTLYASTWSYTSTHGAEIWHSSTGDAGDWTQVAANGFGDAGNYGVVTMKEVNGSLYAGTRSRLDNGADIWRYDGSAWTPVITDGFGYTTTYDISALEVFGSYLYAGTGRYDGSTQSYPGGHIWRCAQSSGCDEAANWSLVIDNGFGNPDNVNIEAFAVLEGQFYAVAYNHLSTGVEVWRTSDGASWEQVDVAGFGDSNNYGTHWGNSVAVHNGHLYLGTYNPANGGEVWLFLHNRTYLPALAR